MLERALVKYCIAVLDRFFDKLAAINVYCNIR